MGGFKFGTPTLAFFALALSSVVIQVNAYTMEQTCAQLPYSTYIGDPVSCESWGYCKNNVLIATGKCGNGLLYNYKKGTCDNADNVECASSAATTCSNYKSPIFITDPNNCTQYVYCDGVGGYQVGSCPKSQVFNSLSGSCVWEDSYVCPSDSICRVIQNNLFVGDPHQCGNYIQCENGQGTSKSCGTGYYFNVATGVCQNQNPCGSGSGSSSGSGSGSGSGSTIVTPPATNSTICSAYPTTTTGNYYIADGLTCYGFYLCTAKTAVGKWGGCQVGTHFNQATQECVSPVSFPCTENRCANLYLNFVTAANTKCNSYYYCQNQQEVVGGTCPTNYPFFNEISQTCVSTTPGFPICT